VTDFLARVQRQPIEGAEQAFVKDSLVGDGEREDVVVEVVSRPIWRKLVKQAEDILFLAKTIFSAVLAGPIGIAETLQGLPGYRARNWPPAAVRRLRRTGTPPFAVQEP